MNRSILRLAALLGGLVLVAAGGRLALAGPGASPADLSAPSPAIAGDSGAPAAASPVVTPEPAAPAPLPGPEPASVAVVGGPPVRLAMPQRGLDAPVLAVGVLESGALQLPDDPGTVGWWAAGALPGDPQGTVVVAGHLDDVDAGIGALAALHTAGVGDRVELADGTGGVVAYTVESRRSHPKAALPPELFVRDGPPRLALITCGGAFDERRGHYADNVVVLAVPA